MCLRSDSRWRSQSAAMALTITVIITMLMLMLMLFLDDLNATRPHWHQNSRTNNRMARTGSTIDGDKLQCLEERDLLRVAGSLVVLVLLGAIFVVHLYLDM